jgi:hypoxanthine phosphoribosyltransferase
VGFGVIYIIIGAGLFVGERLFSYLGVIFPLQAVSVEHTRTLPVK